MANIVQQFKALNAYVDGVSYLGRVSAFSPAQLAIETEPYRSGGMDVGVPLDTGMKEMEVSLKLNGVHRQVYEQFGKATSDTRIEVRGALEDYDGLVTQVIWNMVGMIKTLPTEALQGQGEVPAMTIMMGLNFYEIKFDGDEVVYIDAINMIRRINGEDRLDHIRAAIGA